MIIIIVLLALMSVFSSIFACLCKTRKSAEEDFHRKFSDWVAGLKSMTSEQLVREYQCLKKAWYITESQEDELVFKLQAITEEELRRHSSCKGLKGLRGRNGLSRLKHLFWRKRASDRDEDLY